MHAAFLLNVTPSCRGITGDALIATIYRRSGLALPGGRVDEDQNPKDSLTKTVIEINYDIKNLIHIYTGLVDDKHVGAFTATTIKELGPPKIELVTIDELLRSQADLEIRRWLVESLISLGLRISSLSQKTWVACFGSGTLQNSCAGGLLIKSKSMYLHERTAFELFGAKCVLSSRISSGPAIAEPDCKRWTEALWSVRNLRALSKLIRDKGPFVPQHVNIHEEDYRYDGYGIVIPLNSKDLEWWPDGYSAVIELVL